MEMWQKWQKWHWEAKLPQQQLKIQKFFKLSPLFGVQECYSALYSHMNDSLLKVQLNFLQGLVLISLAFDQNKEISPGDLVQVLGTSKSLLSQALSGLEEKKLLKRILSENDARCFHLQLTSAGERRANEVIRIFDQMQRYLEETYGEKELKQTLQDIAHLTQVMAQISSLPPTLGAST